MIVWGSKGREVKTGTGEFYCPKCQATTPYNHIKVKRYFTLYFIPLFPTSDLGEYIKCLRCGTTFKPEVLDYRPPSAVDRAVQAARTELESGTPLEMARGKLVNQGIDPDTAEKVVNAACGSNGLRTCPSCNFRYLDTVSRCASCGSRLC